LQLARYHTRSVYYHRVRPYPTSHTVHPANVAHSFKRYRRANVAAEEPGALSPREADHADAPLWDIEEDFTDFNLVLFWGIVGLLAG
jgi:hypothetical protein